MHDSMVLKFTGIVSIVLMLMLILILILFPIVFQCFDFDFIEFDFSDFEFHLNAFVFDLNDFNFTQVDEGAKKGGITGLVRTASEASLSTTEQYSDDAWPVVFEGERILDDEGWPELLVYKQLYLV